MTGARLALVAMLGFALAGSAAAQTRVLPLGDSITNGGQQHASYRYTLWFDLALGAYLVDFVGTQTEIDGGDPPNLTWYPDYLTSFDPDHDGYWGSRTDEILVDIDAIAAATQPDVVLAHLGTNDIGQNGAQGVLDADANLRTIIARLRLVNPNVTVLLARVIPIGCCTSYFANEAQVGPLNAAIDQIALDLDTGSARVLTVDLNTGFDLPTMMQSDGLHPNTTGEDWMAGAWQAALAPFLQQGNPPPQVLLTAPASGASFATPASVDLAATASDLNGSVVAVRFYADAQLLGQDTSEPYELTWSGAAVGSYVLTAEAEDDEGATGVSPPVAVDIVPPGSPVAIAVSNASFETPLRSDGQTIEGPADHGGWVFAASGGTFLGIFNPPAGSYPEAAGNGTPIGADGINAAYLFNNSGPGAFVETTQQLAENLQPGNFYDLRVAVGRFLPGQPYVPSSYGGYRIQLLAGGVVVAEDVDTVDPPVAEFRDAQATVSSNDVDPGLIGQPLSIRLTISVDDGPFSTHFDDVRLTRTPIPAVPALPGPLALPLALALLVSASRVLKTPMNSALQRFRSARRRSPGSAAPRGPSGTSCRP